MSRPQQEQELRTPEDVIKQRKTMRNAFKNQDKKDFTQAHCKTTRRKTLTEFNLTVRNLNLISRELFKLSYYIGKAHATSPGSKLQFEVTDDKDEKFTLTLSKRMLDSSIALFNQTLSSLSQFLELCISRRTGKKGSPNDKLPIYIGDNLYGFFTDDKTKFGFVNPDDRNSGYLIDELSYFNSNRLMLRSSITSLLHIYLHNNSQLKDNKNRKYFIPDNYFRTYFQNRPSDLIGTFDEKGKSTYEVNTRNTTTFEAMLAYNKEKRDLIGEGIITVKDPLKVEEFEPDHFNTSFFSSLYNLNSYTLKQMEVLINSDGLEENTRRLLEYAVATYNSDDVAIKEQMISDLQADKQTIAETIKYWQEKNKLFRKTDKGEIERKKAKDLEAKKRKEERNAQTQIGYRAPQQ